MPTYQYTCTECREPLEAVQSFTDAALTECPRCDGRLRKVFSAVGVVFKGSGFYRTDSRSGAVSGSGGGDSSDSKDSKDSKEPSTVPAKGDKASAGSNESGGSSAPPAAPAAPAVTPAPAKSASSSTGKSSAD